MRYVAGEVFLFYSIFRRVRLPVGLINASIPQTFINVKRLIDRELVGYGCRLH